MTDTIEVTVRVPADLIVTSPLSMLPNFGRIEDVAGVGVNYPLHEYVTWDDVVVQQIAAAIEARRPRPPLFQVGDVVEWDDDGFPQVGIVVQPKQGNTSFVLLNYGRDSVLEADLKLVRSAEK